MQGLTGMKSEQAQSRRPLEARRGEAAQTAPARPDRTAAMGQGLLSSQPPRPPVLLTVCCAGRQRNHFLFSYVPHMTRLRNGSVC